MSFRHLSVLVRDRLITYISISTFCTVPIYHIVFSPVGRRAGVSSSETKYDIFRYGDEGTWQKHPDKYSQHKIVDLYLSSMSQTSCSRKKSSQRKNINTHTHTHTRIKAKQKYEIHLYFAFKDYNMSAHQFSIQ